MSSPTVNDAFRAALQHHQAGRYEQAEALYRLALENDPGNANLLHILGVLMHQMGRNSQSIDLIKQAIQADPSVPDFHNNLGNVLRVCNRTDEAIAEFRAALSLNPDYAEAQANLASALHDQGNYDQAIEAFAAALRLRGDVPEIYNNLGITLQAKNDLPRAIDSFAKALQLNPNYVEAHHNLASALAAASRFDEAENHFNIALKLAPDFHEAHLHLANLLHRRGKLDQAESSLRQLIKLDPNYLPAHNNLANLLRDQGRFDEAIKTAESAIALRPDLPQPHLSLGLLLQSIGRYTDAIGRFETALTLRPDDPASHALLAGALKDAGLIDKAIAEYRKALELNPQFLPAHDHLLIALQYDPNSDANQSTQEERLWLRHHVSNIKQLPPAPKDRSPNRRLRIGYVAPFYFRDARLLLPIFSDHDHTNFEIFAYNTTARSDNTTKQFQQSCDAWRDAARLSDDQLASQIRSDQIDILVDLAGHHPGNRLPVFARRPAPGQLSFPISPAPIDLPFIDRLITDPQLDPSQENLLIPHYFCYRPPADAPPIPQAPFLTTGHVTFGCINELASLSAPTLALWREVLQAVDKSTLLLNIPDPASRQRLIDTINLPGRLQFTDQNPLTRIDIALDTTPHNGSLSTCDTLWMAIPTITLIGTTPTSRLGSSLLTSANLPDLIASTPTQYIQLARDLATNHQRLSNLRSNLRANLSSSPLCDALTHARTLESAYRLAWTQLATGN